MKPTITVHSDPTVMADGPFTYSVDLSGYEKVWLPFWTDAERAGLKAMGKYAKYSKPCNPLKRHFSNEVAHSIYAYVKAARAVKESLGLQSGKHPL